MCGFYERQTNLFQIFAFGLYMSTNILTIFDVKQEAYIVVTKKLDLQHHHYQTMYHSLSLSM